jgi:hypothetical protein
MVRTSSYEIHGMLSIGEGLVVSKLWGGPQPLLTYVPTYLPSCQHFT